MLIKLCFKMFLVLISSHSFVNNAVVFLWMDYLTDQGQPLPLAAIYCYECSRSWDFMGNLADVICTFICHLHFSHCYCTCLYVICTFLIANLADAYTGPYKAIVFSTASYAFVSRSILYTYMHAYIYIYIKA